jgi:RNA polymerase sigma factor (sigma-70 family)
MSLEKAEIQRQLVAALNALAETQGEALARQIRPILLANLDRGRLEAGQRQPGGIPAYVRRVAENFITLNPYLRRLQVEQSPEVWEPLYEQMQTWAYNYFLRKGFDAGESTRDIAIEAATDAATFLLTAYFPYDTEFKPWAYITVQHACQKYIQRALRKSVVPEEMKVELEDELTDGNGPLLEPGDLQSEFGDELEDALSQLSEARRAVIRLIFFDELKPDEVAQRLGKSVSAIYTLQFHGLRDLRKILTAIRDNLNE